MRAHLFLPKNGSPPYQTVIFFPAADAFRPAIEPRHVACLGGLHHPERASAPLPGVQRDVRAGGRSGRRSGSERDERELRIAWSRDLGRAIDYLETRSDIDRARLAFYGVSAGADAGVILTALEPRLKASVLQGAGIWADGAPEIDPLNYAPRVRIPTLMLNGRYDFETPFETAQRPLFDLLGSPAEHKRHRVFETGHALADRGCGRRDSSLARPLSWTGRPVLSGRVQSPACRRRRPLTAPRRQVVAGMLRYHSTVRLRPSSKETIGL